MKKNIVVTTLVVLLLVMATSVAGANSEVRIVRNFDEFVSTLPAGVKAPTATVEVASLQGSGIAYIRLSSFPPTTAIVTAMEWAVDKSDTPAMFAYTRPGMISVAGLRTKADRRKTTAASRLSATQSTIFRNFGRPGDPTPSGR